MINIAEILKDCPKGMELDCAVYEDVYFDYVDELNIIHCYIQHETHKTSITLTQHGTYSSDIKSKCVIFPKGKNTWEGFVSPCQFKERDIIFTQYYDLKYVSIVKQIDKSSNIHVYCLYGFADSVFAIDEILGSLTERLKIRFATAEEKQKLFDAIKANGYKWNTETKTLEKLIKPIFKVGDVVIWKHYVTTPKTIKKVQQANDGNFNYWIEGEGCIPGWCREDELQKSDKFDINTLKPFESKVLVRHNKTSIWMPAIFGGYMDKLSHSYYAVGGTWWEYCIPYEGNEHLRGTTDDCSNYYKTWEE